MALIREGSALRTHGDLLTKPAGLFFAHRQLIRIKNQRRKQDMGSHAEKPILGLAGVAISGISISSAHRVVISFCVRLS